MPRLATAAYLDAVVTDAGALVEAAGLGMDAPTPRCPGWTVADVVDHVATIHRWAAAMIERRATERLDRRELAQPPAEGRARIAWLEDATAGLRAVLAATDPAAPVWNWTATEPRTAAFWFRRMAHETVIHRWDAQAAHGPGGPVAGALAVDGVDELLEVHVPRIRLRGPVDLGGTLRLVAGDAPAEWWIGADAARLAVPPPAADVTVRAPASDLMLFAWGRLAADGVPAEGAVAVLERWGEQIRP
ncbi:MAG TPA: maleylpyruvate isomerase family mycothiol-dependent enzyme [Candidatus Dormibacteraeota bacterium]|nr:maleylpyruvate isomerase family mycothiol-dependent enzyme [Candidatus Dormibacteraeota bacterium]